jgi:hypothetical protein
MRNHMMIFVCALLLFIGSTIGQDASVVEAPDATATTIEAAVSSCVSFLLRRQNESYLLTSRHQRRRNRLVLAGWVDPLAATRARSIPTRVRMSNAPRASTIVCAQMGSTRTTGHASNIMIIATTLAPPTAPSVPT